jgi:hypothetical protein
VRRELWRDAPPSVAQSRQAVLVALFGNRLVGDLLAQAAAFERAHRLAA